jgi:hypothetical protein
MRQRLWFSARCHCEERCDEAIQRAKRAKLKKRGARSEAALLLLARLPARAGLLRFARNDG